MPSISSVNLFIFVAVLQLYSPVLSTTTQFSVIPMQPNDTNSTDTTDLADTSVSETSPQRLDPKLLEIYKGLHKKEEKKIERFKAERLLFLSLQNNFGQKEVQAPDGDHLIWACQSVCDSEKLFNRCCEFYAMKGYQKRKDGTMNTCEEGQLAYCRPQEKKIDPLLKARHSYSEN